MYFLYKKTPFRVCYFGGLPRTCLQHENPSRPPHKKTPFRVSSFGGLPRTCLQHENPPRPPHKKNTLSGVLFWWTSQNVFANTRILPRPLYKKHPFGCVLLVDGDGFEPSKAVPADLQSDPFGRSGTRPGAGDWSRTNNLLITNQLLCH